MKSLDPDRSLVLLKAAGQVPHEGGQRFAKGSWEYRVIRAWIADGAQRDPGGRRRARSRSGPQSRGSSDRARRAGSRSWPGSPTAPKPTDAVLRPPRARQMPSPRSLPRGSSAACDRATRRWSPPITAGRRGSRVMSRRDGASPIPTFPASDFVDREVYAKLRRTGHRALGAGLGRRVPPPGNARRDRHAADAGRGPRVLGDRSPDKRSRKIDGCSRTRCTPRSGRRVTSTSPAATSPRWKGPDDLRPRRAGLWHDWFRATVRRQHPLRPDRPRRALRDQPRR